MIKIIGIALSALFLSVLLRESNKTISLLIMISGTFLIFYEVIGGVAEIIEKISKISEQVTFVSSYIGLMFRVLGITIISQFVVDICRDSGENAMANTTETATKVIVIGMILPLFETIINIVIGLLK